MKALYGSVDPRPTHLLAELAALRAKVAELSTEVERLRLENDELKVAALERAALDAEDLDLAVGAGSR